MKEIFKHSLKFLARYEKKRYFLNAFVTSASKKVIQINLFISASDPGEAKEIGGRHSPNFSTSKLLFSPVCLQIGLSFHLSAIKR